MNSTNRNSSMRFELPKPLDPVILKKLKMVSKISNVVICEFLYGTAHVSGTQAL